MKTKEEIIKQCGILPHHNIDNLFQGYKEDIFKAMDQYAAEVSKEFLRFVIESRFFYNPENKMWIDPSGKEDITYNEVYDQFTKQNREI